MKRINDGIIIDQINTAINICPSNCIYIKSIFKIS